MNTFNEIYSNNKKEAIEILKNIPNKEIQFNAYSINGKNYSDDGDGYNKDLNIEYFYPTAVLNSYENISNTIINIDKVKLSSSNGKEEILFYNEVFGWRHEYNFYQFTLNDVLLAIGYYKDAFDFLTMKNKE